jgi:hypothetical protein
VKGEENISGNYRKRVDESLDAQSDLRRLNSLSQKEVDEIWEEISLEMDIDEVWTGISSGLDTVMPVDSGSGIIVKSFAAMLIILIGIIPVKRGILESDIRQPYLSIANKQNEQPAGLIVRNKTLDSNAGERVKENISPALKSSLDKSDNDNIHSPAETNKNGLTQRTPLLLSNGDGLKVVAFAEMIDSNLIVSREAEQIEKDGIPPVFIPADMEKINLLPKTDYDKLKINERTSATGSSLTLSERGRISGGLITVYKNTWLLNYETFDGLKSESLNSTEFVYYPDVGLSLDYSLNRTWMLQAEGFLSSNVGQEYLDYIYGHYSRKRITINYSSLVLSVKHRFTGSGNLIPHSSINVLAGGYISFLHYAYQKINTDLEHIGSQYEKIDFGVRLGGEFEFYVFDQLSLAPGLFLSLGIPNIYKGTGDIPGYLRKTHNGSAELHLAFYYHFY